MADQDGAQQSADQAAANEELSEVVAGMGTHAAEEVSVTLAEHIEDGTLTHDEIIDAWHDATTAEADQQHAHDLEHDQAVAADHGDYAHAEAMSSEAAQALHDAADHSQGAPDAQQQVEVQAHQDDAEQQALSNAGWEQASAVDDAHSAAAYAASGDEHAAENYASHADDHASSASDYGHEGDHGGTYDTSHSSDTAAESGGETTSE